MASASRKLIGLPVISSLLPDIPGWIVLITIARDVWHSEQWTNASKRMLIL
jgi:hypothetical protein